MLNLAEIFGFKKKTVCHCMEGHCSCVKYNGVVTELEQLKPSEERLAILLCKMDGNNQWKECSLGLKKMFIRDAKKIIDGMPEWVTKEKI